MAKSFTDFNDIHVSVGLSEVKRQLEQVINSLNSPNPTISKGETVDDWESLFQYSNGGQVLSNISNIKLILDHDPNFKDVIGYCNFSYRIMKRKMPPFKAASLGEWTDGDTERLRLYISDIYRLSPKTADVMGATLVHAEENAFHPVRDYLGTLKWDGKKRVGSWLTTYLGVEATDYSTLVGTFFLVGAIARVMRPPVKVDNVLILEGSQGLGKSTCLANLFGEWFTDTAMALGEKDTFQQMAGTWGIELAELDAFNKAESTKAKQFFGSQEDRYRPAYGRITQSFPRQCVFVGTTNQDKYLKDSTGNRRYWPVTCTKINKDAVKKDRDQIWAEALYLFNDGMPWWPEEEFKHLFEVQQEDRFDADVWEDVIYDWLKRTRRESYSCADIMFDALAMDANQMKPPEQKRVGQIMHRLGFVKKKKLINGKRPAFYFPPEGFWHEK